MKYQVNDKLYFKGKRSQLLPALVIYGLSIHRVRGKSYG